LAHRHPRAIEAQVQRGRDLGWRRGLDVLLFVRGERPAEGLGRPLDLLRLDGEAGRHGEELSALGEADQRRRGPHHAGDGRVERFPSTPRARSRGQNPWSHAAQW
jgi:hypothetical protein